MSSLDAIVNRQIKKWELEKQKKEEATSKEKEGVLFKPVVTVSRERGSRGSYLAKRLAQELAYEMIHRQIIDYIVKEGGVRKRLVESLDEKTRSKLELWIEGILKGKYIAEKDYYNYLLRSIWAMAQHGEVVILGRGANFILTLQLGFHLRVVASWDDRITNLVKYKKMSRSEAKKAIEESDQERKEFIRSFFNADIDDPHYYDLMVNTSFMDVEDALNCIRSAIEMKFRKINALLKRKELK
jgi:cytidylate kinase